jgi:hypothetical protein
MSATPVAAHVSKDHETLLGFVWLLAKPRIRHNVDGKETTKFDKM